ncbi:MAG: PAS domain S-box protein [Syntrophobacterales bacterium]|nr:PAS domain S-box protein [Syntrophobacterales bacterium]
MKTKRSISRTFMIIMIVIAYFPVVILGGVAIQRQYSDFDKESRQLKEKYIEAQEIIVKHEVEKVIEDIQYRRQNTRLTEKELKKKILKWLSTIRFPNRGNEPGILFVRSYNGTLLMSVSTPELIGKDISKITDPNGINTHEQFMKTIKNPEGGYADYSWHKPTTKKVAPKRTFTKGIPDWKWYIGAGFWFDDINSVIEQKRLKLKSTVKGYVVTIVLTMLILFMFIYMILRYLSGKIEKSFDGFSSFFKEAATQSVEVDLKKLHFSEFEDLASSANKMISNRKQAEELLKKSEERFRTIFESSEEGYYEIDLAGRFTFFNETMRKISGYSAGELMGMSNLEYSTPETAKKMYKLFNEIYKTGKPGEIGGYEGTIKDGTKKTLGLSAYLMRDEKGEPVGFRGIVRDITAHKRAEEKLKKSEERFRSIFSNIPNIAVQGYDKDRKVTFWNKASEKIYGYSRDEAMNKQLEELIIPPEMRENVISWIKNWYENNVHIPSQ